MYRYIFVIEYEGTTFAGWQHQSGQTCVQSALENALRQLTQEEVHLCAAGRTDKGVHALMQVAHGDLSRPWSPYTLQQGINFYLKNIPIAVHQVHSVSTDFHARFSASSRHYIYRILHRSAPSPLEQGRSWWIHASLDVQRMHCAAQILQGSHDFAHFCHHDDEQKKTAKTLDRLSIHQAGDLITIAAQARSFLHRQVRMMVGAVVHMGRGKWDAAALQSVLRKESLYHGVLSAPAEGLYFAGVTYDNYAFLSDLWCQSLI